MKAMQKNGKKSIECSNLDQEWKYRKVMMLDVDGGKKCLTMSFK